MARRRDAPPARREDAPLRGRGRRRRTVSRRGDPRARRRRGLGRRRRAASTGCPRARRRPRSSASRSDARSRTACAASPRTRGDALRRQPAGDPAADRRRAAQVHAPRRPARGLRLLDRLRRRRQPVVAYRESIGAAKVDHRGRPAHGAADRRRRPASSRTRSSSLGRDAVGRALDRDRHRAPTSSRATGRGSARYGKPDGMVSEDLDQNAFFAEPDGTVWLGSSRGLIRFQAGHDARARSRRRPSSSPTRSAGRPARSTRPRRRCSTPGERNFSVSWAGLTFIEPRKVRYRHRMVGPGRPVHRDRADRGAVPGPADRRRTASRCSASRPTARSRARPPSFPLEVRAAWWETVWARALWVLLAAGAVVARRALADAAPRGRAPAAGGGRRRAQRRARRGQPRAARGVVHRRADGGAQPAVLLDGHRGRRQPHAARALDAGRRTGRATAT